MYCKTWSAVFLALALTTPLSAQQRPARAWAAVALTMGGSADVGGLGVSGQLVYQKQPHQFGLRGMVLHDLSGFPDSGGGDTFGELGLLYGRTRMFDAGHIGFSIGASLVAFDPCPHDDDTCFTIGVPMVAEAALSARVVGIGVQAFGNLNGRAPYAGAALFIQLGWLP